MSRSTALRAGEVRVYYARSESPCVRQAASRLLGMLSPDERDRYARMHFEQDRNSYLVAHALTRGLLARLLGVAPRELVFAAGPHGRPELARPVRRPPLRFNLSHTRGLVACAVALETDVGVDVAHVRRAVRIEPLAARALSAHERASFGALPVPDRRRRFFELWTLKEAYLKAVGEGMALPLQAVSLDLEHSPPRLQLHAPIQDDPGRWFLQLEPIADHHLLALAFGLPAPTSVTLRELPVEALATTAFS